METADPSFALGIFPMCPAVVGIYIIMGEEWLPSVQSQAHPSLLSQEA